MNDDLTGVWFGEYAYPPNTYPPVSFIANIDDTCGLIDGRTDEPNTLDAPFATRLFARLSGRHGDGIVTLIKTYDGTGGITHSVVYTGQVDAEHETIEGIWRAGGWSGRFTMTRPRVDAETIELAEQTDIDA